MKLLSWNVNGLRACARNGFLEWFEREQADIVCIQETKVQPDQLPEELLHPLGYRSWFHSARNKGYSGVATFTRRKPRSVREGIGIRSFDREGRVLVTEHPGFVLVNAYFPNSRRDHARLPFKLRFCREMLRFIKDLRASGHNVIVCGDFNIAHREIDLANPKGNVNNAGFLPRERAWMDRVLKAGWVDCFRHFCDEPGHYTWWSYRGDVRQRNIGWRIDCLLANPELRRRLRRAYHQTSVLGSDHCPIGLELR